MQNEKTQTIVRQFMQFLTERNLDKLVELFAIDVDWEIPGNYEKAAWLGKRRGRNDVREFYELLWKSTEPISAEIEKLLFEENFAVIIGNFETKMLQTGKIVRSFFCIQITLGNDLINKYRLFEDSYAVSQSLTKA